VIRPLSDALKRKSIDVIRNATEPGPLKLVTLHFDGEMEKRQQRGVHEHNDDAQRVSGEPDVQGG